VIELYRERVSTLNELADAVEYFYQQIHPTQEVLDKHLTAEVRPVMQALLEQLAATEWVTEAIHGVIEQAVTSNGLKFPKVAMPLRVMLTGGAQSPSIDAVMALLGKDETLRRMTGFLN
jgi:glutamyl-tRNA synthetase